MTSSISSSRRGRSRASSSSGWPRFRAVGLRRLHAPLPRPGRQAALGTRRPARSRSTGGSWRHVSWGLLPVGSLVATQYPALGSFVSGGCLTRSPRGSLADTQRAERDAEGGVERRVRLGAQEGDQLGVVETDRLAPQVAHLQQLAERLVEWRGEPDHAQGKAGSAALTPLPAGSPCRVRRCAPASGRGSGTPRSRPGGPRRPPAAPGSRPGPAGRRRRARPPRDPADRPGSRGSAVGQQPGQGAVRRGGAEEVAGAQHQHLEPVRRRGAQPPFASRPGWRPCGSPGAGARPRRSRGPRPGRSCRRCRARPCARRRPGRGDGALEHRQHRALPVAVPGRVGRRGRRARAGRGGDRRSAASIASPFTHSTAARATRTCAAACTGSRWQRADAVQPLATSARVVSLPTPRWRR